MEQLEIIKQNIYICIYIEMWHCLSNVYIADAGSPEDALITKHTTGTSPGVTITEM